MIHRRSQVASPQGLPNVWGCLLLVAANELPWGMTPFGSEKPEKSEALLVSTSCWWALAWWWN